MRRFLLYLTFLLLTVTVNSQTTTLIDPAGDGGFQNGTTFAANGWTVLNGSSTNSWHTGNAASLFATTSAYITRTSFAGTIHRYDSAAGSMVYFYRDVTFPAGQTDIKIGYQWYGQGESSYDFLQVAIGPTSITPAVDLNISLSVTVTNPLIAGTTVLGAHLLQSSVQTVSNVCVPTSVVQNSNTATTLRLFFIWRNDGSVGTQPPAAIDNISLISSVPQIPSAQPTGLSLSTISTSQINGTFTAATGSPTPSYLVVRYPAGATPTPPAAGVAYTAGQSLGSGVVVSSGTATTFNAIGLSGSSNYDFYVYSFVNNACVGNVYLTATPLQGTQSTSACSGLAGGTYTVGSGGAYATLTAAAAATAAGITGPVVFELLPSYTSTGETFPITFNNNACVTATNNIVVRPQTGASGLVISSSNAGPTIDLNGADYITFDGRPGGVGTTSQLSVINTNTSGVTFRLNNDASFNTLTYLDLQGQNTTAAATATTAAGVVYIGGSTATVPLGNDNNTISYCNIHGTSGGTPNIGIGVVGIVSSVVAYNDNGSIVYNNIYDYFNAATATVGVQLGAGNNAWTVSNNSFYQTVSRTYTASQTHRAIWVTPNTGTINNTASGFVINNNFIGGSAPSAGGSAYTMTSTSTPLFTAMDISTGLGAATSVQGNTITNINFTTTSTSTIAFVGINIANGNNNVGTITGNVVGSATAANTITYLGGSASALCGIRVAAGGVNNIANNRVSGISLGSATISNSFFGITVVGGTTNNITNNRVGSSAVPYSINAGSSNTATAQSLTGISVTGGTTSVVSGNNITNMNNNVTGTGASLTRGIVVTSSASSITNNNIKNLSSSSPTTGTGASSALVGIAMTSTNVAGCNVTGNVIDSLVTTSTSGTAAIRITGLLYSGTTAVNNTIGRNFIHSFDLVTPNSALQFTGIDFAAGNATIVNNMVRLGIKTDGSDNTNETNLRGISCNSTGTVNVYFNSVHIGGQNVGSANINTFAFTRTATSGTYDIKNNIFSNVRSNAGSGGKHYSIFFTTNMTGVTSNYNLYRYSGNNGKFAFNGTADVDVYSTAWVASDVNSLVANPQFINANGSVSTVDLHISTSVGTPIESAGENIASVTEDYDGQTRSALTPTDIGADAGNFIAADLSAPAIAYTALSNRTICSNPLTITATITDVSGVNVAPGTKPRLWFKKSTDNDALPTSNTASGNGWKFVEATNSSSPFTFTFDYSLLSTPVMAGDSISYFITAQDLASTPNVGANIAIFAAPPTSVALDPSVFPLTGNVRGFMILNVPVPITLVSNRNDICNSGAVILNVDNIEVPGAEYQWQSKPFNSTTFTNISGATTLPYTTAVLTDTTDFRLLVACNGVPVSSSPSVPITININNPAITSTTPGSRCGPGTVDLAASTNSPTADIKWYTAATGGTPIATGNVFTTPSITTTTTYYASASEGGSTAYVGRLTPQAGAGTNLNTYGQDFTITQPITLNTVDVISVGGTSITITLFSAGGTTQLQTTGPVSVVANTTQAITLNWVLAPGTYRLMATAMTGNFIRENSTVVYPIALGTVGQINGFVSSITGAVTTSASYYFMYNWQITTGCEGPRTAITATINPPTSISVSAPSTALCLGENAVMTASSSNTNYVYTWSPGGFTGSVYNTTPTETTKFYVNAADAGTGCTALDSITIFVQPTVTAINASPQSFCAVGGSATLTLDPATGYAPNSIQWQVSPNNVTFTNITGANSATYVTPVISATTYYKALVRNSSNVTCSDATYELVLNNPQVTGTTPGSRCGPGTVTLSATANPGEDLNWYASATGGLPLANGNSFTTPIITSTTTYYVAASAGGTTSNVGRTVPVSASNLLASPRGIQFNALQAFTLQSVKVFSTSTTAGAGVITLLDAVGNTIGAPINVSWPGGGTAAAPIPHTLTLNLNVPVGNGHRLLMTTFSTGGISYEFSGISAADFTAMSNSTIVFQGSLTSLTALSTTAYYYFYDWQISTGCEGVRTPVTATITAPPAISASAVPTSLCEGQSSALTVNSANAGYTYNWTPVNVNGTSVNVTPTATTKYYVNANDAGTGCTAIDSVTVTVNPLPSAVSVTPAAATLCSAVDPAVLLTANGGTLPANIVVGTGNVVNGASTTTNIPPYGNYYTGTKNQILVLASELSALGLVAGNSLTSLAFDVVSNTNALGYKDFTIKLGHTSVSALSTTFESSPTSTVFYQALFNPTVGWSEHTFSTPFVWNGTSNLLIETTFSNCGITTASSCSGTTCTGWGSGVTYTQNAVVNNSNTSFVSQSAYYADGLSCDISTAATASATVSVRPNMRFSYLNPTTITWSPVTELFTNAGATTAYTGGNATSVYAKPTTTRTYTVTASTPANCSVSETVTVTHDCSVPVTYLNFKGEKKGSVNVLSWTTLTEINNAGFELQRSANGVTFGTLAFVASKSSTGNSSVALSYHFTDIEPLVGNAYYRLKQVDKDGKITYSNVVVIRYNISGNIEIAGIYPNPVKEVLNVKLVAPKTEEVRLMITDVSGKLLKQLNATMVVGDNNIAIPVSQLTSGVYLIKVICANGCENAIHKFVKD